MADTVVRAGFTYTVDVDVQDYWYDASQGTFTTTNTVNKVHPDFKQVAVTVSWDDAGGFNTGNDSDQPWTGDSGAITITDVISSMTSPSGGKVALGWLCGLELIEPGLGNGLTAALDQANGS